MRWNCPHCLTALAMANEKMPDQWSFSRCYQCQGYALVRKDAKNIIKVDGAPAGERILLPEEREQPILGRHAQEKLAQLTEIGRARRSLTPDTNTDSRPIIKPALRRRAPESAEKLKMVSEHTALEAERKMVQASALSEVAKTLSHTSSLGSNLGTYPGISVPFPQPLPEPPGTQTRSRFLPLAIGLSGAIAVGSAAFLLIQSQALFSKPKHLVTRTNAPTVLTDVVNKGAITPAATRPTVGQAIVSDQVHEQAMAPVRMSSGAALIVRPKEKGINLRQGPGMVFGVAGAANENEKYVVIDWSDRWFKVVPEAPEGKTAGPKGWIRTDSSRQLRHLGR
jgi:hypothetical protein